MGSRAIAHEENLPLILILNLTLVFLGSNCLDSS